MARASAQKNLRALGQKLALEVIEGFDVTSSKAPTYRVFNYTEILRRREMAGMIWYVRRTQAVRFVDDKGHEIIRAVVRDPGLEFADSPGLGFDSNPGSILEPSPGPNITSKPGLEFGPHLREVQDERRTTQTTSSSFSLPPPELIEALHQLLAVFDNEAATILWNDCRSKAADCTVEEVLHFSEVKAASFRTGKIQNPTGFLLVTVPKCFEGQAFKAFREQERKRRAEQQRREEEELKKAQMLQKELRVEQETYRQAEEKLATIPAEERDAHFQQKRREYVQMVPHAKSWKPETLDESVRARIVRELQKEILRNRP
jgi:hypothetical protein